MLTCATESSFETGMSSLAFDAQGEQDGQSIDRSYLIAGSAFLGVDRRIGSIAVDRLANRKTLETLRLRGVALTVFDRCLLRY